MRPRRAAAEAERWTATQLSQGRLRHYQHVTSIALTQFYNRSITISERFMRFQQRRFSLWLVLGLGVLSVLLLFSRPGRLLTITWNEALWNRRDPSHYHYTFQNVSFANINHLYAVDIEVRDGQAVSIVRRDTRTPVDPTIFAEYDTIPKIFVRLKAFAMSDPAIYWMHYTWGNGVPKRITINGSLNAVDDEYRMTISNFKELP